MRYAFELARKRNKKKHVTSVTKSNAGDFADPDFPTTQVHSIAGTTQSCLNLNRNAEPLIETSLWAT